MAPLQLVPDVVSDILRRLPAKSLLRFRCLSSSICAEIDGVKFVKDHLTRSIETKTGKRLIITTGCFVRGDKEEVEGEESQFTKLYAEGFDDGDNGESLFTKFYAADLGDGLGEAIPLHNPLRSPHGDTVVCGSCNGLVLLGVFIRDLGSRLTVLELALWNPFTRRYKLVTRCPVKTFDKFSSCGLGFDSTVDDYKIVMISEIYYPYAHKFRFSAWVFSLKSNSWRRIQDAPLYYVPQNDAAGNLDSRTANFANGALYWPQIDFTFLSFELATVVFDEFSIVPLHSDAVGSGSMMGYGVLDGNLYSALRMPSTRKTTTFYLHVNEEGKVGEEGPVNDEGKLGEEGPVNDEGELGEEGPVNDEGELGEEGPVNDEGELGEEGPVNDEGELGEEGPVNDEGELGEEVLVYDEGGVGEEDGEDDEGKVREKSCWREAFSVYEEKLTSMDEHLCWPLTYSKEGDRILLRKENKLSWYHPDEKTHEEVQIAGVPHIDQFSSYHMCQESLVSLGNDSDFDGNAWDVSMEENKLNLLAHSAWNL